MRTVEVQCLVAKGMLPDGSAVIWRQPILTGKPDDEVMLLALKDRMIEKLRDAVNGEPISDVRYGWQTAEVTIDDA